MRDDFLSRDWAEHHSTMSSGIGRLIESTLSSYARLRARQFDAPWKTTRRERCG